MSETSSSSETLDCSTESTVESGQNHKSDRIGSDSTDGENQFSNSKENLENVNRTLRKSLKRKKPKSDPTYESAKSPNKRKAINSKEASSNILSPSRSNIIEVRKHNSNVNESKFTKYPQRNNVDFAESSKNIVEHSYGHKEVVDQSVHRSPTSITTCSHPSLHKHTQPLTRQTTFDNSPNSEGLDVEYFGSDNLDAELIEINSCDKCHTFESRESDNGFSKLFDENILSIFQWLPKKMLVRCMLVCKRWHRLALDSRLWSRVCLGGRVVPSGVLPNLMLRNPIILRLANSQLVAPVIPQDVILIPWRVQYLDLSAASVTPSCLAKFLNYCPALLRLSLEGLALSEATSIALGKMAQLKVLNLVLTTGLGKEGAKSISKLTNLEALNVGWTGLNTEEMGILCNGLSPTVQRLNVSGFRKALTEDMVLTVIERCPDLIELDLSDCISLSDRLIPAICKLNKLEHLALSRCSKFTLANIETLKNMRSLLCLDVFGMFSHYDFNFLRSISQKVQVNQFYHSGIARPTVGNRRTSIWGLRTRD